MTVRVGLIGAGVMGADHARNLGSSIAGARLGGVFDVARERAVAAVAGIDGARVVDDPLALIEDVEAVLVASADETHAAFVLACLDTGKPVLCEKPLAPSVGDCLRIVEAESGLGRRLVSVGFMRRYDPGHVALKRTLAAGDIGAARLLHCVHRNVSAPDWFGGDMVITNSAGHDIDIARWLLDDEIARITVHRVGTSPDPVVLVLEMASGVIVDVEVFVNARYGYDVRCELAGERGTATASGAVTADWRQRFAEVYRCELQDWVDGVRAGQARGASAWDGYVAMAVAQAGVAALDAGRVAVQLAAKPALYK